MDALLFATIQLIVLHTLDGRDIYVNTKHIVSLTDQKGKDHFVAMVGCAVNLIDHKFVTTKESCDSIRKRVEALEQSGVK